MTEPAADLVELAHAHGVSTTFTDWKERAAPVSAETIGAILRGLGVDASDPAAALAEQAERPWRRVLPPCVVAVEGVAHRVPVHAPRGEAVEVVLRLERGGERRLERVPHRVAPREVDGRTIEETVVEVPADVPLGYHRIRATAGGDAADSTLIVTPSRLEPPERLAPRSWGLAAQLYSVRSAGSWGVGDLTDLADLAVWAGAEHDAAYVLVNPLHAAEPVPPLEPSPYLPSSRRYFSPVYIRVEAVPEYADLSPEAVDDVDALRGGLMAAEQGADLIDRDRAWTAKRAALRHVWAVPRSPGRQLDLDAYRRREGEALTRFATWSVIAEEHGNDAAAWPEGLRDAGSPEVAAYAADHADGVDFTTWLQWVLDEQLERTQGRAVSAGMTIGTMHDLAVGVHPGGADAWRLADAYASGVTVGAPPDAFNQQGQNWNQPPWRPDRLAELAYAPLRDVLGAVLRHAGGVRVDHIIGFFRLWWVPEGRPASEGAYVYSDHQAMIGVLALEAHRAGAIVVGEDLGVVDPSAREYLASRGVLGTSVLWFERDGDEALPAERWRVLCLAAVDTHDLPPAASYIAGDHVRLQHRLGLLTGDLDEELRRAAGEAEVWLAEVRGRGLLEEGADSDETVVALHRYLALTPAMLLGVSLTDAVGDRRTQNQPGTNDEHPNWRVPLSGPDGRAMPLEEVLRSPRAAAVFRAVGGR